MDESPTPPPVRVCPSPSNGQWDRMTLLASETRPSSLSSLETHSFPSKSRKTEQTSVHGFGPQLATTAKARLAQAETRRRELRSGLLLGWQGRKCLRHLVLSAQVRWQGAASAVEWPTCRLAPTWAGAIASPKVPSPAPLNGQRLHRCGPSEAASSTRSCCPATPRTCRLENLCGLAQKLLPRFLRGHAWSTKNLAPLPWPPLQARPPLPSWVQQEATARWLLSLRAHVSCRCVQCGPPE